MRTTLKRGIGRSAGANGNGHAVLPPAILSPVTRYAQPPKKRSRWLLVGKIFVGLLALVLLLALGSAGGAYLYYHESVTAVAAHSKDVKIAAKALDIVPANHPAIALVIGYDKRKGDTDRGRSDTLMLLRADPETKSISMLSFPRDLIAPVWCGETAYASQRINQAYALCGSKGALDTVKKLTGLPINYLITVNFKGFIEIVDRVGGVWVDVDHRYFNRNVGTAATNYANIDLRPGYQRLKGRDALSYVRFRHTDSDLYRVARQQQFVKAFKGQIQQSFGPTALPKVVNAITHNVEVAQGGGADVSGRTVLSYALFAYGLPKGRVFQTRIEGLEGTSELTTDSANITRAVQAFEHPDVDSSEKATAVALGEKLRRQAPAPNSTTITVLNGNGVSGSASTAGYLLGQRAYEVLTPPNGLPANAPTFDYFRTKIYYDGSRRGAREAGRKVANLFASAELAPLPRRISQLANGAMLTVVVGQTFHGSLASAPIDQTPKRERPNVTFAPNASIDLLRARRKRVPFPLMVPTVIERSSWTDSAMPVRLYRIDPGEHHKAVRVVYRMGSNEYWGIEMTDWDDAPVLADKNLTRHIGGRSYDLYYNGSKLHMVVLRTPRGDYWVINTLLDRLSNETMIAIAKGLKPFGAVKRK
jgi:LCP family protein required for cell wall assembly